VTVTNKRVEIKELFNLSDMVKIEQAIALSKYAFYKPYPVRKINSLYFDTVSYDALEESIEGNSLRKKTRLRWYGNKKSSTNAVLELKFKKGSISWKHLYKNEYLVTPEACHWSDFVKSNNPQEAKTRLYNMIPVSIVTYDRKYYISCDGKIRLTIDTNLKSYLQHSSKRPNFRFCRNHIGFLVLEIKVSDKNQSHIKEVLKEIPFSAKRFSKYCESIVPQKYYES
jgi:hypothetical protein